MIQHIEKVGQEQILIKLGIKRAYPRRFILP